MSVLEATAPTPTAAPARPLVEVSNLGRIFDVSKPWLNRVIEHGAHDTVSAWTGNG